MADFYQLSHQGSPRILEWVAFRSPGYLPNPGIEPGSSALQLDSSPAELPGKPMNLKKKKKHDRGEGSADLTLLASLGTKDYISQLPLHPGRVT